MALSKAMFDNFPSIPSGSGWSTDFMSDEDITEMVVTAIAGGGATVLDTTQHGILSIAALATTDNCGAECQLDAGNVALTLGKNLKFMCRFKVDETTSTNVDVQSDVYIGVGTIDTSIIASAPTAGIYFRKDDDDAYLDCIVRSASADVATSIGAFTIVRATWYTLAFEVAMDSSTANKGTVTFYVDGTQVASVTNSSLPSTIMSPFAAFQTGDATGTKRCDVDFIAFYQTR